jgi:O-antigen ligase
MMLSSRVSSIKSIKENTTLFSPFLILATLIALAAVGAIGLFSASFVVGAIIMALIVLLRRDEVAITAVLLVSLYYDWYQAYRVMALILMAALLIIFFLNRSLKHPWVAPRALWLWALFLGLAIFPAIRGALTVHDFIIYYPSIVLGALIMFWLGTFVARDATSIRRFFNALVVFGMLIALHSIIQVTTGITLFESPQATNYLLSVSNYQLSASSNVYRLGSFFIQPNFSGTFFAIMFFIPLGLFIESTSFFGKVYYLVGMALMLAGLLVTYSASAWIATGAGTLVFVILVGRNRLRFQILLFIIALLIGMLVLFPVQTNLLIQHAADPSELALRNAVWQTALRVIRAYPLTGVGLGHLAYLQRAEPYRVIAQIKPFDHPHNSYLEWGAMAGIPVLLVFLALLSVALWWALRNWKRADLRSRSLIGAGIAAVIALSFNSWSNQGWTLPPLAALGWVILGSVSSPLLMKKQNKDTLKES